ncbi:MAG: hypothetical protein KatS3mg010_1946 [Acidimicrobiia bacterium]|nr:MAG: hypothetical protein KatS3mg010_1946 [Acidimicrobiia bacterium]
MRDYDDARAADHDRYARLFHGLLDRGVHLPPSGYEAWFPSLAHTSAAEIDRTLDAVGDARSAAVLTRATRPVNRRARFSPGRPLVLARGPRAAGGCGPCRTGTR